MDKVIEVFNAEIALLQVFLATDKRISVNDLNNISSQFGDTVYNLLPSDTKSDLEKAGQCILFELPTAAAFHLLRGIEAFVRHLLEIAFPRDTEKNWSRILSKLKTHPTPPDTVLIHHLDNIRKSFRNPTIHPEKNYDMREAENLFFLCIEVSNRYVKYLEASFPII